MSAVAIGPSLPTQYGPITLAPYQQAALVTFHGALDRHRCQIAFLPTGCVDGDALIPINRAGKGWKIRLADLVTKFNGGKVASGKKGGGGPKWDLSTPTHVRSMCDGIMRLNRLVGALDKGLRPVLKIALASGKALRVTPDHEVAVPGGWSKAADLYSGCVVLTNGTPACKLCGGTERVAVSRSAKFKGYCIFCIKRQLSETAQKAHVSNKALKGGYKSRALPYHPRHRPSGVSEHSLAVEAKMNGLSLEEWVRICRHNLFTAEHKFLPKGVIVHHENEVKHDNAQSNLEVMPSASEHATRHGREGGFMHLDGGTAGKGGAVIFVPKEDKVVSVEKDGEAHVYDLVCEDPHRNFVANGVIVHNCGKTVLGVAVGLTMRPRGRVLILVHRKELVDQWLEKIDVMWPSCRYGVIKAEKDGWFARDCVVASVQSLSQDKRLERLCMGDEVAFIIADECFVEGTLVEGRPIETIRAGDLVSSLEESSGRIVKRKVVRTFKSEAISLVAVTCNGHRTLCTPSHPFMTKRGWIKAASLTCSDMVLCFTHEHKNDVRPLRGGVSDQEAKAPMPDSLLQRLQEEETRGTSQDNHRGVLAMPSARDTARQGRFGLHSIQTSVLLEAVHEEIPVRKKFSHYERDQPKVLLGSDEVEQPHAQAPREGEGADLVEGHGLEASGQGRQRPRHDGPREPDRMCARLGPGDLHDEGGNRVGLPEPLQDRRGEREVEGGDRDRRTVPFLPQDQGVGPQEGGVLTFSRVERVEVLEPGDLGQPPKVRRCRHVYNLEVEGTHTYVANGMVVHNCHHAPSETWMKILNRFPKTPVLGLTATPTRADKKTLAQAGFTAWCYRMNAHEAIRFGYLAPLRAQTVPLAGLDEALSRVRVVSGEHGKDFEKKSLGRVMEELRAHEVAAAAYAKHASARKGIIFTVTVEQARKTAEALSALGIVAGWVSGDMESTERARVLREHREGKIRVVANCGVLTEGYDDPSIDCGLIARPTQSKGLYVQMAGRVLRKHPAKKFALILDMVGAHEEHGLVVAPRLGKAPSKEEEEEEAEGLEVLDRFEPEGEVVNEEACVVGPEPTEKGTMEEDIVERFLCAARGVKTEKVVEVHAAQWVECGPALFALSLGPDEGNLVLFERGGSWLAERTAGKASEHIAGPSHDLGLVQGIAENYARDKGALGLSVERAIWRASEPTPEQERVLASMPTFYVEGITRGEAQDTILAAKVRSRYGVQG